MTTETGWGLLKERHDRWLLNSDGIRYFCLRTALKDAHPLHVAPERIDDQ